MSQSFTLAVLLTFMLVATGPWVMAQNGLPTEVVVHKAKRQLILFRNGVATHSFSVCLGDEPKGHKTTEGDEKTPEGRYTLSWKNPNSAFYKSFLISYPNAADKAQARRRRVSPGGAIMLHGCGEQNTTAVQKKGIDWTDGCIAVLDHELDTLWKYVPVGTPITIHP